MADLDFNQIIGGAEDGFITALTTPLKDIGAKSLATYSGDLDAENLKKQLTEFADAFPRVLVAYANGRWDQNPKTAPVLGRPLIFRHDCWFAVIVASNQARSEKARRRGANSIAGTYQMVSTVLDTLTGLSIRLTTGEGEDADTLTLAPLMPTSNECILRVPTITAYAVVFSTFFRWKSPDRTAAGIVVNTLDLDVSGMITHDPHNVATLPGVEFET